MMPPLFNHELMEIIPLFLNLDPGAANREVETHNIQYFLILEEKIHDASRGAKYVPPETQIFCRPLQITDNGCKTTPIKVILIIKC